MKQEKAATKQPISALVQAHPHSSLLDIDKKLIHGQQHDIAKALIGEQQNVKAAAAQEKAAYVAPKYGVVPPAAPQASVNQKPAQDENHERPSNKT